MVLELKLYVSLIGCLLLVLRLCNGCGCQGFLLSTELHMFWCFVESLWWGLVVFSILGRYIIWVFVNGLWWWPLFFFSWWLIIWNVFVKSDILRWLLFFLRMAYYLGWFCWSFIILGGFVEGLWWFIIWDGFVEVILGGFVEGLWWFIIWGWRSRAVAQEAIVGPPLSTSFKISSALGEVLFYNVAREVLKSDITFEFWLNI